MYLALGIVAIPAALLAAGMFYQMLGARRDRLRFTNSGRWISIGNGSSLYLQQKGAGEPTVIFEAGFGATHLNWRHIQESIASLTATAAYDRSGLGWSSACRTARTPSNIAAELHEMLDLATVRPPYILVGHSFGGLVMRRFALLYPGEVVGLVLVDPMRSEEWPPVNPARQSEVDRGRKLIRCGVPFAHCGLARLVLTSLLPDSVTAPSSSPAPAPDTAGKGLAHVVHRLRTEVGKMHPDVRPVVAAHWSRPAFYTGMRKHMDAIHDTVLEMHAAEPILDIPIVVLTPGKSAPLSETAMMAIGNRVQQVIAPASAHWVHLDQPSLVIDAIRAILAETAEMIPG